MLDPPGAGATCGHGQSGVGTGNISGTVTYAPHSEPSFQP